jgi:hypothetical protein
VRACLIYSNRFDLATKFLDVVERKFPNDPAIKKARIEFDECNKKYWSEKRLRKACLAATRWLSDRLSSQST